MREKCSLDIVGNLCDNVFAYLPCVRSVFASTELSVDPTYDPDANKPWWELAWKAVVRWYAGLDIGIKIAIGSLLFIAAVVLVVLSIMTGGGTFAGAIGLYTGARQATAIMAVGMMALGFAIGIVAEGVQSAAAALYWGGDVADALIHGLADGVFFGGLFAFVSAGINAVKAGVRSVYNAKFLGRSQTGAQPCSTVNYPPNNGAVPGSEEVINLAPGKYGRYGKIMEKSNYITDVGVSASQLSLPPWNNSVYTEITVVKTIPNVVKSTVAPWIEWNGVGGGVQYMLPMSIMELKNLGYIVF